MEKIKFFSKKLFKAPALITMFLLAFVLISFGAKSLIAALNSENLNTNKYAVQFPTNLEGISENGIQYAIAKKSTEFIGTYQNYSNWQPTAGINSINIDNSDKIKFLIKFDEGYSNIKVSDIKLFDSELKDPIFSLKVYDYDNNRILVERDPKEDELIIPGKNYPTSEFKVNKNLNLSLSGIKADSYHVNISMEKDPQKTKELINVYYYASNESEKKKMNFSEISNSYELNGLAYNSGINLIIEMTEPYTQTKLDLEDLEGISEFINKTQTDTGVKLNTAINKNYDIKITKTAEKNTYSIKNNTPNAIEYKLSKENEYKTLASENSFTATHGENYDFKYENLEKILISNNNILHKNNYIYSLYNVSENIELNAIDELSKTNVPIYLPEQENGILIVDESGENQLINPNIKYGNSFSFRLKQVEGYTQNFDNIEVYKNDTLESSKTLIIPNNEKAKDECSGLYTIDNIKQPIKIETSKPIKNVYEISVAQNLKNAKIEVSGQNVQLDENTKDLGTKVYSVVDGGNLEITVTPNEGFSTNKMTLDVDSDTPPDVSLANNKFTVSSIKSNTTLSVRNIQETATVNFSAGINYTNASSESQVINKGENFSFKLKENLSNEFFIVKANDVQLTQGLDGSYTISNIQENQSITVEPDKNKNVTVKIEKNNIPENTSISYKINDTQDNFQDIKNVNSLEVPADSSITFQKKTNDDLNLSIKSSTGENIQTFDANNQYTVNNITSPLTISPSRSTIPNVDDNYIHAWSLAKTYKFGTDDTNQAIGENGQKGDYEIKFKDHPTDVAGSTVNADGSYTVQFKRIPQSESEGYDPTTFQGWSNNNELYIGPKKLNIDLKYGNINNAKNFLGFRVDGKRKDPNSSSDENYIIDKDIFNIKSNSDHGAIQNNINKGANNSSKNTCTLDNGTNFIPEITLPNTISAYQKLATPRMFQDEPNSFAAMFKFFKAKDFFKNPTSPNPLFTRYFETTKLENTAPFNCLRYNNGYPASLFYYYLKIGTHIYDVQENPRFPYSNAEFGSLFISQNLNFDLENHNTQNLIDGNLEYDIQSKYVKNINGNKYYTISPLSNTQLLFGGTAQSYNVYDYNSRLFNTSNESISYRSVTSFEDSGHRTFHYFCPKQKYCGTRLGYFDNDNYNIPTQGRPGNIAQTSSFNESGQQEDGIRFVYFYDEIILTPIFKNTQFATESTIEMPLDTEGLDFYETYTDDANNLQKSKKMTQNRYTVTQSDPNTSAEFNFVVKVKKGYDFEPNSIKVYPEGFGQINYNGELTYKGDDGIYHLYNITNIYSNDLKVSVPDLPKHEYTIQCNRNSSNFYDTNGEKFLMKKIKAGEDFTFETEAQPGYKVESESLNVNNEITITGKQNEPYTLLDGTTIQRTTTDQSIKNIYEIKNLSSDITLTSSRPKKEVELTFMCNDEAFDYKDSQGNNLNPNSENNQDPNNDYFIIKKSYGTNLNFRIETKNGYDSTTLVATANGSPIEYVNGQYRIKTITENTTIKVESIEKIKYKLVLTQHEGVKFKDEKDNILTSEKELRYGDNFTFKTEITDAYSKTENYRLVLERATSKDEISIPPKEGETSHGDNETNIKADPNNPNIYHIKNIKENCRVYVENLDYKKHNIKLYKSDGIIFKDKYGNSDLESTSNNNTFITQQALHNQPFSFKVVANEGYDISNMKLFAKKDVTGTRQQLFPSNDVYTIENITEDYTITLEKVEKTQYSVEIRLTDGVKCVDQNGDTMKTNLTVSHGDEISFYLSLDSAYSKASPAVSIKGVLNQIMPDSSGKYTISNITENKIIEISGVKKNTYKATFVSTEGVIYKNNKNKPFENSLDVEYGESLYFKITLMDAYDKSTPLVMMNDNKVIAESAGIYTVSNVNNDITITVKNVTKNPEEVTMENVNDVPDPVITDDDVNSVVKATLTYENLSDEEKEQVTNLAALQKAQKEAGELNHKSGNIYVNGLDWNIKVIATELTKDEEKVKYLNSKIDRRELINLYDIYLLDLLTGKTYEIPYGQSVDVTMPAPNDLTGYQNIVIAHEKSNGNIEYLDVNITDNTVKFTATSFSLFGLAAKKTPNYSENPSSTHISVSGLVENEEELKTLLGEGVVSQIGDLTEPDNFVTSFKNQDGSSENGITSISWWYKFYKWALNNEFLIVLLILLFGSGAIWLILLLAKRHQQND